MRGVTARQDAFPDVDSALELAVGLAAASSLSESLELTLPALARASGSQVVLFALAGSAAAGARCWPRDADWSRAFDAELSLMWEDGPLTELCRAAGVVPPFRLVALMRGLGWSTLPIQVPVDGAPLRYAAYLAVSAVGPAVCGYFMARVDRDYTDVELDRLTRLQAAVVASHGRFVRAESQGASLTPRQNEILRLMQQGLTAGAIASRLGIGESTVSKHLRDLYARLDTHDRVSTLREAQARGLLDGVVGEPWQDVRMP